MEAPRGNFELNEAPEMGLPTSEDLNQKKSTFALAKEQQRLEKLQTDKPKNMYLIETVSNLVRCSHVETNSAALINPNEQVPMYQITDLGFQLSQDNLVLFDPPAHFIV